MELHKAIKEIVNSKGAEMICNPQIINYLLDYQSFKEKPATKLILRAIIDSGYAENVLALISDKNGWEIKFRQYQHEFIDSCGYKEELAAYVFDSIAYGLGLGTANVEPEIKAKFNVDSFFDIPEVEQKQPASPQPQQKPSADPSDLYTIALSFFNEGKYQQAKGFMEKALAQYAQSNVPALYLKLIGDVHMKIGSFQEALQYYNECFVRKAAESKMSVDKLREALKQHKVKGFENSMFCYFFSMYYAKGMSDAQWLQFVKGEAKSGLMDAIRYCADNGINPIEDHYNIYFVDRSLLKSGDFLYTDGSFSHEYSTSKKPIAKMHFMETSDYEKSKGWNHGYIIPLHARDYDPSEGKFRNYNINLRSAVWSMGNEDLPFPHSHYTEDDINHWEDLSSIESEHFISINDYNKFPAFFEAHNFAYKLPISGTSPWFLPSIHHLKRFVNNGRCYGQYIGYGVYWTSSQASADNAIAFHAEYSKYRGEFEYFKCENKSTSHLVLPVAAF